MSLNYLPETSRIWIFVANRKLSEAENALLSEALSEFAQSWKAHGKALSAGYEIQLSSIVILAVDESAEVPSGCSIDKAFRLLQEFGGEHKVDFFQRTSIVRKVGEDAELFTKQQAISAFGNGSLNASDLVADTTLDQLGSWLRKPFIPFSESWLGKMQNAK